jgi:phage gp36-like protein
MMLMNTDLREGKCLIVVECVLRCCAVWCCRIVVYFLSDVRDNRRARGCVVSFRCPAGVVWSVLSRFIHVKVN